MSDPAPAPFSIDDPLPTGTTLLEASAGTGKTWAIAALVTRYVAEGVARLDDLLVVTFGRAASAELRDRVRDRLVRAEAALDEAAAGRRAGSDDADPLLRLLCSVDPDELARRRDRLRVAVSRFDEATITTTHGFCHAVLRSLGTMGDVEPGTTLVEDDGTLLDQVVSDLYLGAVGAGEPLDLDPAAARALGRAAVQDPAARLEPRDAPEGTSHARRRRFAERVREESARRRLAARSMSYDDLLDRLAAALADSEAPARQVMRERWRIVLVDEFQDTDPVQWQILERAFLGHATVVLVGDPKQAIYAFRGGDVDTYLAAAARATDRRTLHVNHRSDAALVERLDAVLRGAALGDERIVVRPVTASHAGSRLSGPGEPFRLRVLSRYDAGVDEDRHVSADVARTRIAADLAADVAELLADDSTRLLDDAGGAAVSRRVRPGDVAVLVERHREAEIVHDALRAAGLAAVHAGGSDVLRSDAADQWLTLLTAMESPHRSGIVRAAALTPFLGHRGDDLADDDDAVTDVTAARLRDLSDVLRDRGAAGLVEVLLSDPALVERVLAREGGRRLLTDLEHVGHLLQEVGRARRWGLNALLRWLADRRSDDALTPERTRRLDSDADAVQIVTTFVSKGLQYPVVYAPFLFNRHVREQELLRYHDVDGTRCLDVGGPGSEGRRERDRVARAEDAAESLRLLYVAMTRAQSRLVMHWAPTWDCEHGALHRLLFRDDPAASTVPDVVARPSDADAVARLRRLSEAGGPALERVQPRDPVVLPDAAPTGELVRRRLERGIDTAWTRTSYSSLVRIEKDAAVGSEPAEQDATDDEVDVVDATPDADETTPASPWADVVSSAALGTIVHAVLEDLDVRTGDLDTQCETLVRDHLARRPVDVDPSLLAELVLQSARTPLGPSVGDATLLDLLALDPLRELDFELPLSGGDRVRGEIAFPGVAAVADVMDSCLAADDPMRPFAATLRSAPFADRALRGYLTGSIDLLARVPDGRTLVADHKTNRLDDAAVGLGAYAPERLDEAMLRTTYPLQAMLYAAAQHRFLRWRLRGYDPEVHLGGVLYLFLRGMTGPQVPRDGARPYGVFAWHPPAALAVAMSDLLDGVLPDVEGGA